LGYVFFNPRRPSEPMNIDTAWKACRKAAGLLNDRDDPLDRVYLHSTRHTAVTRMLKGGANLAQAAVVSGHQTLAMLKRYEHLAATDPVDLAEKHLAGTRDLDAARPA
jgi:integrase